MKNKILFFLCFILSSYAAGQNVKLFKNFGIDNPISDLFVRTIAQDQHEFMWFGSSNGLHRFDGYQFVSYHHDSADKSSLSSDVVSRILIDKQQRFWVGTSGGGLNLYQENENNFFHISTHSKDILLTNNVVNALLEDSNGNLWVGTENGLNILSSNEGKWSVTHIYQKLGEPRSLTHNSVNAIVETNDKEIWVGTNGGGVSVFDLSGNFIRSVKYKDKNTSAYPNKFINTLLYDKKGQIWIGTVDSGLLKYDPKNDSFSHYVFNEFNDSSIPSNTIKTIYQNSSGELWVATDKGLIIYDENKDNFTRFNHMANNPYSLSSDYILTFFEDVNQLMWIGTVTGVNRWDPNITSFNQFNSRTTPALTNNNITSFAQFDDKTLLFSTYSGGIYQLTLQDSQIEKIDFGEFFSELTIMSLYSDISANTLWVGTRASGLYEVNLLTKKITTYQNEANNPNSISANSVTDIIKDRNGIIWASTFHQGLNKLNKDGTFSRFTKTEQISTKAPSINQILQLLEDDQGYIWLASYGGGLNRFDPKSETFIHIRNDENDVNSLSSDLAWFMFQDEDKNLWVGTQAAGLNILSHENMLKNDFTFTHLDTKDGMKSRSVYGITQDSYGDIWFSSNKGVSRYSLLKNSFKHFDLSHGLVDLEYNHGSIYKGRDNSLYFGAAKGFISVNPELIDSNQLAPEVRLTNVLKLNEPMSFKVGLSELSSLELDYSDQLISFEYVGLNYAAPASTRYKYRLLGFDQEWIEAGKSRRATYTNLPAGSYTLQIIAGNNDDVWSEPGYSLAIVVTPAPWNTWWAYLLYAMAVAAILLVYSRFLNRKLLVEQQQKSHLKKQVKEKTQKLQSQNSELEHANTLLEKSATVDKVTGVRSRRYLDIYIEQTSQLMNQIHQNILPVQRSTLPRLYVLMVQVNELTNVSNSQLINITDLLLFSRNTDDLVVRWSDDTFAVIGYEKDNNASELAAKLANKFEKQFDENISMNVAYSFYPFNREQPMDISWDQVSVMIELGLKLTSEENTIAWLGLCEPKIQPFSYLEVIQGSNLASLKHNIQVKQG